MIDWTVDLTFISHRITRLIETAITSRNTTHSTTLDNETNTNALGGHCKYDVHHGDEDDDIRYSHSQQEYQRSEPLEAFNLEGSYQPMEDRLVDEALHKYEWGR